MKIESFTHPDLRYKNDTQCFDDTGYVIFVNDIIKVICYGGPNYYQVLPMTNGSFKIKQLDLTPDEIEHYGENVTDLSWLMCSYMGKVVIPKDSIELEKWLYRINQTTPISRVVEYFSVTKFVRRVFNFCFKYSH